MYRSKTRQKRQKLKCKIKQDSPTYLTQRQKANARKRRFLDKMTDEQKEIKRCKDRAYYRKKKAEGNSKSITQLTEQEKRKKRNSWKEASKKYRNKQRNCKINK